MLSDSQNSRLLDIAFVSAHKGKIREANVIFDALLKINENFAPALIGFGLTSIMVDKFAEGEIYLKKVLDTNPDDQEALAILALGQFLSGEISRAQETAKKIRKGSDAGTFAQDLMAELG